MKGSNIYKKAKLIHEKMYQKALPLTNKVKQQLYKEFFLMIKKAAYLGNAESQYDLAQQYEDTHYLYNNNPNYNPKKCIYWYTKACNQNYAPAFNNLAYFYENGIGCKQDIKKALDLYKTSSELGYSLARKNYKLILRQIGKSHKIER